MKKILTLFSIALGLFLCTSAAHAQDKEKIKEKAKKEAYALSKDLGLDDEQQHKVAETYYRYYLNTEAELSEKKLKADQETYFLSKKKFNEGLYSNIEKILSPSQLEKYKELLKKRDRKNREIKKLNTF